MKWRDEVLAAIILLPMVVAMIVWQLEKRSLAVMKGDRG